MSKKRRPLRVPIHVSMELGILDKIDEKASNRSGWINKACQMRLAGDGQKVVDASTRQLMAALAQRDDVDHTLALLLFAMLKNS